MLPADTPVLLLTTGGTIDKIYFDALSDYQVGETVVARLLEIGRVKRPFRVEEAMRKDSLELTDADRAVIRDRVVAAPEAHVVITHGTDTMTDTAAVLAEVAGKVIVLVGAGARALRRERCQLQPRHGLRRRATGRTRRLHRHERIGVPRRSRDQGSRPGHVRRDRRLTPASSRRSCDGNRIDVLRRRGSSGIVPCQNDKGRAA